jgi:RimJ/RimL family protein N-acetyltransferase
MTLHAGQIYQADDVTLRPPLLEAKPPMDEDATWWWSQAAEDEAIYYFAVFRGETLVGQILLHDIDTIAGEALIGYHLFQACDRGQGIGTRVLDLLKQYIAAETDLKKVVIITSRDNPASQRIAEKCGFEYVGASREDPINGMVFQWDIVRSDKENR